MVRMSSPCMTRPAIFLLTLLCVVGCGSKSDVEMGQVEGIVTLDGKPVTSGKVLFQPQAGRGGSGAIQSDGTFVIGTYGEADGAVIGEHKVAVVAFPPGRVTGQAPSGQSKPIKPLVPERYLAAGTSELTFEVKPGDNHAEFKLTTP
jgi:hypothetical protein